jgi:hypothetical protein
MPFDGPELVEALVPVEALELLEVDDEELEPLELDPVSGLTIVISCNHEEKGKRKK